MSESINKSDIIQGNPFTDIAKEVATALAQLELFDGGIRKVAKTITDQMNPALKSNIQGIEAINKAEMDSEKLIKQKLTTQSAQNKLTLEAEKIKQAQMRTEKQANAVKEKTLTAYQKESRLLTELRNKWKDLAVQNRENTREGRALLAQVTQLDNKLKKIDGTVGQSQRNVGNYNSALGNLRGKFQGLIGVASQFGLALGGVAILRKGIQTITEFETSIADLSAITGATGKDLEFLENKSIEFSKQFGVSARDVSEAFKLAGSARPELLKNGDALAKLTEQAILLSKASGDDLPTSITNLAGALNAFDLPASEAGKAMDILSNAALLGVQEIPYLTEAFTKFGGIASLAGVGIAESAAAIELLGVKIPEASIAGNNFKNILTIMQIEAAKQGRSFEGLGAELERLGPSLNDVTFLSKTYTKENLLAIQTLIKQRGELGALTEAYDKDGTTKEMAEKKSRTLTEAWKKLTSEVEAQFLSLRKSTGGAASALNFLAKNIGTVLKVLGLVIKLFVAYRLAMLALKLQESYRNWIANADAIKQTGKNLEGAEKGARGFGAALKGIGLGIAITLLFEMGMALYKIASGAAQAEEDLARLNKAADRATKSVGANIEKILESTNKNIAQLNRDLAEKNINQTDFLKLIEVEVKSAQKLLNTNKELVKDRKAGYEADLKAVKSYTNMSKMSTEQLLLFKDTMRRLGADDDKMFTVSTIKDAVGQLEANINAAKIKITEYNKALSDNSEVLLDASSATKVATNETADNTDATVKSTKAVKDNNDEHFRMETLAELKLRQLREERELLEDIADFYADKGDLIDVDGEDILDEERLVKLRKEKYLDLLESKKTEQEINEEMLLFDIKMLKEKIKLHRELGISTVDLEIDLEEKKRQLKDTVKANEEIFQAVKNFQEALTDVLTEQIDERINQLKREEDASKKQQDYLMALAENGNITAQQSLAEQIEIQKALQLEQQKMERRKQQILLISQGIATFSQQIQDGKTPGQALTSTITSTSLLVAFLKNIPFFAKGTLNAPEGLAVVDEKGAELITDKLGNIKEIGQGKGARTTYLSKGDKVHTAGQTAQMIAQFGNVEAKKMDSAGNSYDMLVLNKSLKEINQSIQNKPVSDIQLGAILQGSMDIVRTTQSGSTRTYSTYKVRR